MSADGEVRSAIAAGCGRSARDNLPNLHAGVFAGIVPFRVLIVLFVTIHQVSRLSLPILELPRGVRGGSSLRRVFGLNFVASTQG